MPFLFFYKKRIQYYKNKKKTKYWKTKYSLQIHKNIKHHISTQPIEHDNLNKKKKKKKKQFISFNINKKNKH